MLVISPNLVLSPAAAALPDGTPIILYENFATFSTLSASSEDDEYPVTNLANPATNIEWRASPDSPIASSVQIDAAINSAELIDGVGIARHNFGSAQISVTILSVTADSPSDPVVLAGPQIPPNDEPMLFQFTAQEFATLRILLENISDTPPRAAVLYVGPLLICERGFDVSADFVVPRFGRRTNAINGRSERGDFLGRIITSQFLETELNWRHFTPSWYRTYFDPFVAAAQRDTPFFLSWNPVDYPYEVGFHWLLDDPMPPTSPVTGRFGVNLKIGGIVE